MFGQITSSDKDRQIPMSGTYQVFLIFSGSNTRFGFTGYLYKALTDRGIHTFIDDEQLQRGDQIKPALMKAIQESMIAIPVLSTNYTCSPFCLYELTLLLHRSNSKAMLVLPIFYEVDPSDVRHWKGSYGDALAKHEERLKHNMDKLQSLKDALSENGGIGKSTLARTVYNSLIAENFDGTCFLDNVREKSNKDGLEHLQCILFSKILKEKDIILTCWQEGASMMQKRFQRKKVLLVLDDVDDLKQLKACVGSPNWFGLGSKVIITTRDVQLLLKCHIKTTYEVETLNNNDALHLLTLIAFKGKEVDSCYEEVLNRLVTYASGLPLALEVIGSNLAGKNIQNWEDSINQYERIPPGEIQNILKISFDALNNEVKSVFLDIACFFRGYEERYVEHVLGAHYGYNIKPHLEVLVEKSLLKLGNYYRYTMHDLIEKMGKNIVNQESSYEPAKHSRLWSEKDIIEVLEENKKLVDLKVLNFDYCKFLEEIPDVSYFPNLEELSFDSCKKLTTIHYSIDFLDKLKILSAEYCSNLKSFPPLNLPSLQVLYITRCSSLDSPLNLPSINAFDFSGCSSLGSFPEITEKMNNLHGLDLYGLSIAELPWASFQNLCGLRRLYLGGCGVVHLPSRIFTELGLILFVAERCEGLHWANFEVGEELSTIQFLIISDCNLSDDFFDKGFQRFARVNQLNLSGNNFTFLPECINELQLLERLIVNNCYHLREIRGIPRQLKYLETTNCESLSWSSKSTVIKEVKVFQSGSINEARGDIRVLFGFVISFPLEFSVVLLYQNMTITHYILFPRCTSMAN
ncbi:hypothetical protein Fmac_015555 [Flemingia macrophylla]|uniref:TIR domain-containing protein n=1 Tax=Flemingia macrophylla TaxID=520843 RepID=A0ABD1MF00_9FABA